MFVTNEFVANFQLFLLVLFRIVAMVQIAPLISSSAIPQIAKIGISLFIAGIVFPAVVERGYAVPDNALYFFLVLLGEVLIGILIGFFLVIIFATFQLAGQFFSLQMGFGASQVFDPLAQIEIPLMGQFLNIIAMFVFISTQGFYKFVLVGVHSSFDALRAIDLVTGRELILGLFIGSLGRLFATALTISFPILGTLFLISISTGLLAKAAPQMNLLMMGFPVAIGVAFIMLLLITPMLMNAFSRIIDVSFESLQTLIGNIRGAGQ
ncbi:MAG TPA: flagellar biosynthetic protein FliR [Spirochaetia bacterium]|nr:flagellar biosynthetic protein FliR [Spirochaetia bacterium]